MKEVLNYMKAGIAVMIMGLIFWGLAIVFKDVFAVMFAIGIISFFCGAVIVLISAIGLLSIRFAKTL